MDGLKDSPMANEVQRILSDIRKLAPEITTRASEIEAARSLPVDLVEKLRSIGVFRLFVPRSHGGLEADLPEALAIIEALCKIDGSVGWVVSIVVGGGAFAAMLPRESYDLIYGKNPDAIITGSAQPAGTAEAVAGGWRVNGRWPFASGCQHADWLVGFCLVTKDGKPLPGPAGKDGPPAMRCVVLPARDWTIEDTWYATGLKGSGSHHIALKDAFVPDANSFDPMTAQPWSPGPLYQAPQHLLVAFHSPMALGIASAALDELAKTGRQQQRSPLPLRESEIFQYELGRIAADLKAARAFYEAEIARYWRHALAGTLKDEALLVEGIQSSIWITAACVRVAEACFALGGSSTVYDSSPLQRRMRDVQTAAQHQAAQQRHYAGAGKLLLSAASN